MVDRPERPIARGSKDTIVLVALIACSPNPEARATEITVKAERAAPVQAAPEGKPRFNCRNAVSVGQKLICSDAGLAKLDVETARLYDLAANGKYMIAARMPELIAGRDAAAVRIDACARVPASAKTCAADAYVTRIQDLRTSFSDARSQDDKGVSNGPRAMQCAGLTAGISIVLIHVDTGYVGLQWLDKGVTLVGTQRSSGRRYVGTGTGSGYALVAESARALFTRPGKRAIKCTINEIG